MSPLYLTTVVALLVTSTALVSGAPLGKETATNKMTAELVSLLEQAEAGGLTREQNYEQEMKELIQNLLESVEEQSNVVTEEKVAEVAKEQSWVALSEEVSEEVLEANKQSDQESDEESPSPESDDDDDEDQDVQDPVSVLQNELIEVLLECVQDKINELQATVPTEPTVTESQTTSLPMKDITIASLAEKLAMLLLQDRVAEKEDNLIPTTTEPETTEEITEPETTEEITEPETTEEITEPETTEEITEPETTEEITEPAAPEKDLDKILPTLLKKISDLQDALTTLSLNLPMKEKDKEPEDGAPEDEEPEDEVPEDGEPEDEVPEDEEPEDEVLEDGEPEDEVPEDGEPEDEVPEDGEPEDEVPEDGEPEDEVPEDEITSGPESIRQALLQAFLERLQELEAEQEAANPSPKK